MYPQKAPAAPNMISSASDIQRDGVVTNGTIKALKVEMGDQAELLEDLPFSKATIQKLHKNQKLPPSFNKKVLGQKIQIGKIENESRISTAFWAYLLDNDAANRSTELVYYSYGTHSVTRHTQDDAHSADLREEFGHCATPAILTATAKYYLYHKGVTTSHPIVFSKTFVKDITRSCKDYREGIVGEEQSMEPELPVNAEEAESMPLIPSTPLDTEASDALVTDTADVLAMLRLQDAQKRERELCAAAEAIRQRYETVRQRALEKHAIGERLVGKLTLVEAAFAVDGKELETIRKEYEKVCANGRLCKDELERIVASMSPKARLAFVLDHSMERSSQ